MFTEIPFILLITLFMIPLMASIGVCTSPIIASKAPPSIVLQPSQTCPQLPVNTPVRKSISPWKNVWIPCTIVSIPADRIWNPVSTAGTTTLPTFRSAVATAAIIGSAA